jgi:hypothetical protein
VPRFVVPLAAALVLAACTGDGSSGTSPTTTPTPASTVSPSAPPASRPTASPTPPAVPASPPPTRGPATTTCLNGWRTPRADTPRFTDPLGIIRRTTEVEGLLVVVDMRYFTGPESPPSEQGYLLRVERWYVKLYAEDDEAFQGRFLVEMRGFGRGLSAVAPYDTRGFRSPDWRGFQYDSSDTGQRAVPRLPGLWSGIEYDFVNGGEGLTIPGLPPEIAGCLAGT